MIVVNANSLSSLSIGRHGENLARQVVFDVSDWEAEYGHGVVELIAQRPGDEKPYPVAVKRDGTQIIWEITSVETSVVTQEQTGKCELRYYVGDVLAKSKTWRLFVDPAMDTPSETAPPEPEHGWLDQIIAVGAAVKASADAAKADADRVASLAEEVSKKAAQTAHDASDAAKAMEAAQTAKRLAEEAQGAAEAARTAAAAAQSAAEKAATDAAAAKQGAETAMQAAQEAAAAAANALEAIRTLYQEMQTWAQGVIQDVNAAGSAAVQSVQSAGDAQVQRVTDEGTTQTANAKAQANAAAQSASGAAQSAQEAAGSASAAQQSARSAAESAAVYDDVASDVNQLKEDLSDNAEADAETRRKLDYLWKLNQGISYQFETDDAEAYQKTVPSGAKVASVEVIGGHTESIDGELVSADVESVQYDGTVVGNIPDTVRALPGYGWSAGNVCNSIERTETGWQYVQRVGSIDLGTLAWSSAEKISAGFFTSEIYAAATGYCFTAKYACNLSSMSWNTWEDCRINHNDEHSLTGNAVKNCFIIKDLSLSGKSSEDVKQALSGMICYYRLTEPITVDITNLMAEFPVHFEVEAGGAITLENAEKLPVPSTEKYLISLAEVNQ